MSCHTNLEVWTLGTCRGSPVTLVTLLYVLTGLWARLEQLQLHHREVSQLRDGLPAAPSGSTRTTGTKRFLGEFRSRWHWHPKGSNRS